MRVDLDRAQTIAAKALDHGGFFIRPRTVDWRVAGKCLNPFTVTIDGRPTRKPLGHPEVWRDTASGMVRKHVTRESQAYPRYTRVAPGQGAQPLWVDLEVGCRRCPACRKARGVHWRERAKAEIACAHRTWFGTLTLTPHEHCMSAYRAGPEFDTAPPAEQFRLRHGAISPLITKYLKRIRKHGGKGLRFLIVAEAHESGLPHYHMLVHEPYGVSVRQRLLKEQWTHGFSRWKLVDDANKAASYCAKYLFKSSMARVRASAAYGDNRTALGASPGAINEVAPGVKRSVNIAPPKSEAESEWPERA